MLDYHSSIHFFSYSKFGFIFIIKGKKTHSSLVGGMKCLNEGLKNISVGTTDYTGGADVIPNVRLSAMKPEAHKSLVCG